MEREKRAHALAGAIVLAAAVLRFWHLGAGVPYAVGVDEPEIMERVAAMMKTGDYNPRFFDWPSLTLYLQLVVAIAAFLAGAMRGLWTSLDQLSTGDLYLTGRALTAALGTATVGLIYLAGRRWSTPAALLAAALLAVASHHVRESRYVLADVPAAFFVSLTLLLALRAHERQTPAALAWAGAAAGLAASTKYNGVMVVVLPLLVVLLGGGPPGLLLQRTAIVLGATAGAFLLGTPYAVLDLPKFLADYARLAAVFARERAGEPGWSIYLTHLRITLGWPALLLTFSGLALAVSRILTGPGRLRWLLLVSFSLIYFRVMAGSYQIYGRYLVPLLPFAALLAGTAAAAAFGWMRRAGLPPLARRLAAAGLVVAMLAPPARTSIAFVRWIGLDHTTDLAYHWIDAHVAPGSKIAIESRALLLPASRYAAENVRSLLERRYEDYLAEGFDYLIASRQRYGRALAEPDRYPEEHTAYQELFERAAEIVTFEESAGVPGPELRLLRLR